MVQHSDAKVKGTFCTAGVSQRLAFMRRCLQSSPQTFRLEEKRPKTRVRTTRETLSRQLSLRSRCSSSSLVLLWCMYVHGKDQELEECIIISPNNGAGEEDDHA